MIYFCLFFGNQTSISQTYTTFDFLRLEMDARAAALGNSNLAIQNDPAVIFRNPGAISTIQDPSASIGFLKDLIDINAGYASYVQKIENIGWFGGGVTYLNWGSMKKTDKFGNDIGTFGAGELAVSAGYGNVYENLHYGGAVKFIFSSIDTYTASALALDAGISYSIPSEQIVLGMSVLNIGTELSHYLDQKLDLPLDIKIGISKKLEHLPLLLNLNFHKLNESQDNIAQHLSQFSIGGEFTLSDYVQARIGYNNEMHRELKLGQSAGLTGFSAGLGILVTPYKLDYAVTSWGDIGYLHRISLGTTF